MTNDGPTTPPGDSLLVTGNTQIVIRQAARLLRVEPQRLLEAMLMPLVRDLLNPETGLMDYYAEEGLEYDDEETAQQARAEVARWMEQF